MWYIIKNSSLLFISTLNVWVYLDTDTMFLVYSSWSGLLGIETKLILQFVVDCTAKYVSHLKSLAMFLNKSSTNDASRQEKGDPN